MNSFDWAPAKRLMKAHAAAVDWGDDDGGDGGAQKLTQFFAAKVKRAVNASLSKGKGKESKDAAAKDKAESASSPSSSSSTAATSVVNVAMAAELKRRCAVLRGLRLVAAESDKHLLA